MDIVTDDDWQDWEEDPYGVNETPANPEAKTQDTLTLEPEYAKQDGIKFEFTGTLLIPAPGEVERLAREKPPEMMSVVGSKPIVYVPETPRGNRFAAHKGDFKRVKMNAIDALRLRQRGA